VKGFLGLFLGIFIGRIKICFKFGYPGFNILQIIQVSKETTNKPEIFPFKSEEVGVYGS